jgi:hypothetical protein
MNDTKQDYSEALQRLDRVIALLERIAADTAYLRANAPEALTPEQLERVTHAD